MLPENSLTPVGLIGTGTTTILLSDELKLLPVAFNYAHLVHASQIVIHNTKDYIKQCAQSTL